MTETQEDILMSVVDALQRILWMVEAPHSNETAQNSERNRAVIGAKKALELYEQQKSKS